MAEKHKDTTTKSVFYKEELMKMVAKLMEIFTLLDMVRFFSDNLINYYSHFSQFLGNCIRGNFELELTSWGLEGFFICSGRPGVVTVQATKLHPFRPTDSQCGLIWEEKTDTLEGRWTDALNNDLYADICFRNPDDDNGDDDDETVQGSLKVVSPTGEVVDTFISGFWGKDGRILSATWYQDLTAGAILMWLRNNGDIDYTWWTGLVYDNGDTFIEYAQATNPLYHGTGTYKPSANRTTTFDECKSNEILQYFVLKNLPRDDDDNYYYFLDTQYIEPENIRYFAQLSTDNSATGISVSLAAIFVGVLALIF